MSYPEKVWKKHPGRNKAHVFGGRPGTERAMDGTILRRFPRNPSRWRPHVGGTVIGSRVFSVFPVLTSDAFFASKRPAQPESRQVRRRKARKHGAKMSRQVRRDMMRDRASERRSARITARRNKEA